MDPIQMLTEDHQKVRQLFQRFQQAGSPQEKQTIAQNVFQELSVHSVLEKEIFYPAVQQKVTQDRDLVEHSYHDHATVEQLVSQLKSMDPSNQQYTTMFQELISNVEEHAQEEEQRMFPDAQQHLGGDLQRLGQEMQQRKQALMGSSAPS